MSSRKVCHHVSTIDRLPTSEALATLAAIIVLALCAKTQTAAQDINSQIIDEIGKIVGVTFHFDTYDKLGIATGAATLITIPIM